MLSNIPPTTLGIPDAYVDEDAPDEIISLYAAFDDAEDADEDLIYEVVGIDEVVESGYGSLFDDVYIDGYGGDAYGGLVLDFAENAYGEAEITVRATDTASEWVETTFMVYVASVNDVPTTSGISDVEVNEDAANTTISLHDAFADIEDADEDMFYDVVEVDEVIESGHDSLFDSVSIDGYGGDAYGGLVLDFAENAYGEAEITVRATDTAGEWVETTFMVYVASVNDAPTTSGISDVDVNEDAANTTISLHDAFADIEDADDNLTYEVVENTNSSLFDSMDIDGYGGLVLDFAADAFGTGYLTVRATDSGGLWVETTFAVDVAPVNDAPVITDFGGVKGAGTMWTFSGEVTDVDDNVEGMIVVLGGVLEGYNITATVQADGTFSLTDSFPGLESGTATAQTEDDAGLESNVAWYLVTVA